jgi:hypothetical protein
MIVPSAILEVGDGTCRFSSKVWFQFISCSVNRKRVDEPASTDLNSYSNQCRGPKSEALQGLPSQKIGGVVIDIALHVLEFEKVEEAECCKGRWRVQPNHSILFKDGENFYEVLVIMKTVWRLKKEAMAADAFSNHRKVPENNSPIAAETSATRKLLEINDAAGNAL